MVINNDYPDRIVLHNAVELAFIQTAINLHCKEMMQELLLSNLFLTEKQ
jgi:hypothetical protein